MAGSFNKLRKKPKHVRDNVAFGVASGFTFMVAIAWFLVGFGGESKSPEITTEETNGAFSTLLKQIQEQVATVKEGVKEDTKASSTMSSVTGEWGLSAQNASSSNSVAPKEAAIMIITSSSTTGTTSTHVTPSVLY
ncbi:MAG: hypothetical protein KBC62_00160 [Candidatus Pacebacteria bacterium]|nr:hypothetical protein [Candidatus Paceibacterota bacterium]MBP9842400.1 hypothetical protein [Candidatus Paceibacterota bacterium]